MGRGHLSGMGGGAFHHLPSHAVRDDTNRSILFLRVSFPALVSLHLVPQTNILELVV